MSKKKAGELPIIAFESIEAWARWLTENHATSKGVWLKLRKKASVQESVTYAEALDTALCYGWIDGQKKPYDESFWLQRFTRRRLNSKWSKKNTEHAARLIKTRKMKSAGLAEVKAAKNDGRWELAYDSQSNATIPEDFLRELKKDNKALEFFKTLNKTNLYSIAYRLQTAKKPETRVKRMNVILEMMKSGKKFH